MSNRIKNGFFFIFCFKFFLATKNQNLTIKLSLAPIVVEIPQQALGKFYIYFVRVGVRTCNGKREIAPEKLK